MSDRQEPAHGARLTVFSTKVGYDFGSYRIFSGAAAPEPANVVDTYGDHTGCGVDRDLWSPGQRNLEPSVTGMLEHQGSRQTTIYFLMNLRILHLNLK